MERVSPPLPPPVTKGEFAQKSIVVPSQPPSASPSLPAPLHSGGDLWLGMRVPVGDGPPSSITTKHQEFNEFIKELILQRTFAAIFY